MTRVLITAFEPYEQWQQNASWLTLVELTRDLPNEPDVTTRLYPVDYDEMAERLAADLVHGYDYVIHTGQAPGRPRIELETIAINRASDASGHHSRAIDPDAPLAYAGTLPAESLCEQIKQIGVPAAVSYHAGTYLCNAVYFRTLRTIERQGLHTRAIFVHVPLDPRQTASLNEPVPSLPANLGAKAFRVMLESLPKTDTSTVT